MASESTLPLAAAPRPRVAVGQWLRVLRLRSWAHFLVLPIAGVDLAAPPLAMALALSRGVLIAFCVLSFGYLANALADRRMDLDARKNPLLHGWRDEAPLKRALLLLAILALVASAAGPAVTQAATVTCLASGWVYSLGPRWKRVPLLGTLLNVLNFTPLLYVGLGAGGAPRLAWLAPAFAALLLQNQLLHEAADADEDRAGGLRTSFLQLGARATAVIAAALGVPLLVLAWQLAARAGWPPAVVALALAPFVIAFPPLLALRGHVPAVMKRARRAQRWTATAAGALLALMTL